MDPRPVVASDSGPVAQVHPGADLSGAAEGFHETFVGDDEVMLEVRQHRVAGFSGPLLLVADVVGERDGEPDPVADVVLTDRVGAFGGQFFCLSRGPMSSVILPGICFVLTAGPCRRLLR